MHIGQLLLLLCVCAAAGRAAATATADADTALLWTKQSFVLELLQHMHQTDDVLSAELRKLGAEFAWSSPGDFGAQSAELVAAFRHHAGREEAQRGHLFTIMDEATVAAVRSLVRLLYYAQDWATFQRLAVWSRLHINAGMFVYALTVAVQSRTDMAGLVLPALHETCPHLFYAAPAIEAARRFEMMAPPNVVDHAIVVNYTSGYGRHGDAEARLAYFTEDVGLNEYYMHSHMDAPFWLRSDDLAGVQKPRRGELFLFQLQALLARYHLERLSNGLGAVADFSFYQPIEHGYASLLAYPDGRQMPVRPPQQRLHSGRQLEAIERFYAMERRVRDAVDLGRVQLADGSSVPLDLDGLGNLMQANPESANVEFYGPADMYAHELLGGLQPRVPGVLQHYETSMRDPMFYRLYGRLLRQQRAFLDRQPAYTEAQLHYANVRIAAVEMDQLNTTFGAYRADLSQAVDVDAWRSVAGTAVDKRIRSVQQRLQHDHFAFRVRLHAQRPAQVLIKLFLGPKLNELGQKYTLNEMREHFFEIDEHVVELAAGANVVGRNCAEFPGFAGDRRTYADLYAEAMRGTRGEAASSWPLESGQRGFPLRLLLPRGQKAGLPVQFFVYVMPFEADAMQTFRHNGDGFAVHKERSFGFPLDRKIDEKQWSAYGNMMVFETKVFHREH